MKDKRGFQWVPVYVVTAASNWMSLTFMISQQAKPVVINVIFVPVLLLESEIFLDFQ